MNVLPIAADSLGVRSMATLVTAGQTRILIDPGVTVAERRFHLPPSPVERQAQAAAAAQIVAAAARADAIFVTSYARDHCNLLADVVTNAPIYCKTPTTVEEHLDSRQLFRTLAESGHRVALLEGLHAVIGEAEVTSLTPPGAALTLTIRHQDRTFLYASEPGWPLAPAALQALIQQHPDMLFISGAPVHQAGETLDDNEPAVISRAQLYQATAQVTALAQATGARIILDHQVARHARFRDWYREAFATGRVCTVAELQGRPDNLLEAHRATLHPARTAGKRAALAGHR